MHILARCAIVLVLFTSHWARASHKVHAAFRQACGAAYHWENASETDNRIFALLQAVEASKAWSDEANPLELAEFANQLRDLSKLDIAAPTLAATMQAAQNLGEGIGAAPALLSLLRQKAKKSACVCPGGWKLWAALGLIAFCGVGAAYAMAGNFGSGAGEPRSALPRTDLSSSYQQPSLLQRSHFGDWRPAQNTPESKARRMTKHRREGSRWIFKDNPLPQIVNEYTAAGLFELLLGEEAIARTILVQRDRSRTAIDIAHLFNDELIPFNLHLDVTVTAATPLGSVPFSCVFGRDCPPGIRIQGVEKAILASLWLDDTDTVMGLNFALLPLGDGAYQLTRYDFDRSFRFLEKDRILAPYLFARHERKLAAYGKEEQAKLRFSFEQEALDFVTLHSGVKFATLMEIYNEPAATFQTYAFRAARAELLSIDPKAMRTRIWDRISDLASYVDDQALRAAFAFEQRWPDIPADVKILQVYGDYLDKRLREFRTPLAALDLGT